jgi:hypothetical protein
MEEKRSWWQKARKPLGVFGIIVVCILIIALLAVIVMVYVFNVNVPGLRGKTLWDWLQLLIIPLVLAVIALVFQLANSRTERQIAKQRYEQDQQIALDKQREDLLQAYLDRMSELLLKESLRTSPSEEVRNVARVRTIAVLNQLDARRVYYVFAFLSEAGLTSTTSNDNVVSLIGADFHNVNWSQAHLFRANLSKAFLVYANLSKAQFFQADLSGADLKGAKNITIEELEKQAKSLKGATMPDGSIHP